MKTSNNRVCNVCKSTAKIWDKKKWWCKVETLAGEFNLRGYCNTKKGKK